MHYVLVPTGTKSMAFTHAHLLKEQNISRGASVLLRSKNYFCERNYSCSHICLILFIILAIHVRSVKCLFLQSRVQEVFKFSSAESNTRYSLARLVNNTYTTMALSFSKSRFIPRTIISRSLNFPFLSGNLQVATCGVNTRSCKNEGDQFIGDIALYHSIKK